MSDHSQGPGWWQASDAKWYPPETHPSRMQAPAAPPAAPAAFVNAPGAAPAPADPGGFRGWKLWLTIGVGALIFLGVAAAVFGSISDDDAGNSNVVAQGGNEDLEEDEEPNRDETADDSNADTNADTTAEAEEPPQPGDPNGGTRNAPWAYENATSVTFDTFGDADGSVWDVTIGAPRDMTAEILASDDFTDPPPDDVVFVGFSVDMTLVKASKVPLSPGFNFTWELLGGSTAAVYDRSTIEGLFRCGGLPDEFNDFAEIYVGGSLAGTVCIALPAQDLDDPLTQVALNFSGSDRVIFGQNGTAGSSAGPPDIDSTVATGAGSGDRQAPHPYNTTTLVTFETFGDADGSVWEITVGAPGDMTAAVLAENEFTDPPPDGVVFVGFTVDMTLISADKEPLSPGFNFTWELLGGTTLAAYEAGTISDVFGCGFVPDEFDNFSEIFVSGNLTGTVCIPLPTEDLGLAETQVALSFAEGNRVVFGQ